MIDETCGEVNTPPRLYVWLTRRARRSVAAGGLYLLALALVLAGCRSGNQGLDRIQRAGVLRVAIDPSFPPFESIDNEEQIIGFDADLAQLLAQDLGVNVHFVTTGYDALFDALTVGRADVAISALYPDPSRSGAFTFSQPYFNAGQVLVVPATAGLATTDDLAGKTVACVFGTEGHMAALKWVDALTPPPTVLTVDEPTTMTTLLRDGAADALVVDQVSAQGMLAEGAGLKILARPVTDEPYVVAARREDVSVIEAIDAILEELAGDGTLDRMTAAWMRPAVP